MVTGQFPVVTQIVPVAMHIQGMRTRSHNYSIKIKTKGHNTCARHRMQKRQDISDLSDCNYHRHHDHQVSVYWVLCSHC